MASAKTKTTDTIPKKTTPPSKGKKVVKSTVDAQATAGAKVNTKPMHDQKRATRMTSSQSVSRSLKIDVLDTKGNVAENITLPKAIFGVKVNAALITQAVRVYLMNQHQGNAHAKTRGQVTGSTRKIYRQKGTGKARHGAITAPTFVGGGKALGPQTRHIERAMPKKMRRMALFSALAQKLQDNNVIVVSGIDTLEPKTRNMAAMFTQVLETDNRNPSSVLFVAPGKNDTIVRSVRNLQHVNCDMAANLNTYDVLKAKKIVFMKDAISVMESTFLQKEHVADSL